MNRQRTIIHERQDMILRELQSKGVVYISDLCAKLDVTDMTIRRDLTLLAEKGLVERFHGGARAVNPKPPESDTTHGGDLFGSLFSAVFSERIASHAEQKNLIAAKAASFIQPGELVFLNSGTTGLYLLKHIAGKSVRIVSNNASMALIDRPVDTELTISGGEHFARTQSFVGPVAKHIIMNVFATKCFLSVSGISCSNGITCSCFQETEINNLMIQRCQGSRVVIADGSKVGVSFSFVSCQVDDIDMLITDKTANMDEVQQLRDRGIEVIIVDA